MPQWWGMACILLLTVMAYTPALQAGWIWDDDSYVTQNALIQSADGAWRAWIPGQTPQYYPLVFVSFWLQYHVHGLEPFWFHAVNLLLHCASAVLLWSVLRRLNVAGALLAAAIFALHPVQVESVAWVTERKNVLSMFFALSCVWFWLRWRPSEDEGRTVRGAQRGVEVAHSTGWLLLAVAAYLAALLSKTTAVAVPVAIAGIEWWRAPRQLLRPRVLATLLVLLTAGVLAGLHTASVETNLVGATGQDFQRSFAQRLAQASQAWWFYPSTWVWPADLNFIQPFFAQGPEGWLPWLALAAGVASVLTAIALARRGARGPLVLLAIYAAGIVPALGFINVWPLRYSPVADHFGYVAGVAMCIALAWSLVSLWRVVGRARFNAAMGSALAGLLLALLAVLTWSQCWPYQSEATLWEWTLHGNPRAWIASNNLGNIELKEADAAQKRDEQTAFQQHLARAEELIERTVDVTQHKDMPALANLAEVRRVQGRLPEAMQAVNEAVQVNPNYSRVRWQRARLHEMLGNADAAGEDYKAAATMWPADVQHLRDLIRWQVAQRDLEGAASTCNMLQSRFAPTAEDLANWASILLELDRVADARAAYQRALDLAGQDLAVRMLPRVAEAHLRPPHDYVSLQRGRNVAMRMAELVPQWRSLSLLLQARADALEGKGADARQKLAQADALLANASPEEVAACADARARAVAALAAIGLSATSPPPSLAAPTPTAPPPGDPVR